MRSLCCYVLLAWLAMSCPGQERPAEKKANPAVDAAADLQAGNEAARNAYRGMRERLLAEVDPVVLWDGDDLVFRHGSQRRVSQPTPAVFHDLKISGHMILGVHALLALQDDKELNATQLFDLKRYHESVGKVRTALRQRGLTKPQLDRQEQMLGACEEYLGKIIDVRKVRVEELRTLLHGFRPALAANNADAARAQLDGLHREMLQWKSMLTVAEWKKLRVIVQGSQQPRKDHLAVQYFSRLLEEPAEGGRILYAEAIFDEKRALTLLGTKLADARVGQDIWDEPLRLHRDLLGEAARAYLDELFKK